MQALIEVILPVFLVLAAGYVAVWTGYLSEQVVDGLMKFAQNFAVPCLLFAALARLDLGDNFKPPLLVAFYVGALSGFLIGFLGARLVFQRPLADSVAIGFGGLFSNSVLLGLPITERAFGADALDANYAIIAMHAPFCYAVGIFAMELVRARGAGLRAVPGRIFKAMFRNALVIGLALGFIVNITNAPLPTPFWDAVDLIVMAALPTAIFGLGGVLVRYRPEGDLRVVAMVCGLSLVVHPALTFGLAQAFDLSQAATRSAVMTAAMAPGLNTFLFASQYGVAMRVAATTVLVATLLSVITIWVWLQILA